MMQMFCHDQPCDAVAPNERGFLYGDGVVTCIRVRDGSPRL